jgi:hypothetical protein
MRVKKAVYRKLLGGGRVKECGREVSWMFESKCPDKWLHIDLEDGRIYVANVDGGWKLATPSQIKAAAIALDMARKPEKIGPFSRGVHRTEK